MARLSCIRESPQALASCCTRAPSHRTRATNVSHTRPGTATYRMHYGGLFSCGIFDRAETVVGGSGDGDAPPVPVQGGGGFAGCACACWRQGCPCRRPCALLHAYRIPQSAACD